MEQEKGENVSEKGERGKIKRILMLEGWNKCKQDKNNGKKSVWGAITGPMGEKKISDRWGEERGIWFLDRYRDPFKG
jgi:hypothetical protein